jgi:hypothetical protein
MIRRRPIVPIVILATSLSMLFVTRAANAGPALGFDADLAFPIDSPGSTGGGFGARFGYELHLPLIAVTPEIGFTYHGFGGDFGPNVFRGIAGGRVGIGEIFRVGALAHIGYGHMDVAVGPNYDGFTWDAGGFVDFTLIPVLNIGVHVVYNSLAANGTSSSYNFLTTGLDVGLAF